MFMRALFAFRACNWDHEPPRRCRHCSAPNGLPARCQQHRGGSWGLRAKRGERRVKSGRKIIAQGKRSAALGNEAIMNIGVGGWLPRAAVAALLCPGLFSPCPSGAADGAFWIGYDCPQPNSPKTLKRTGLSLLGLALGFVLCSL